MSKQIKHHFLKSLALSFPQMLSPSYDNRYSSLTFEFVSETPRGNCRVSYEEDGAHQGGMVATLTWLADPQPALQRAGA